MTEQVEQAIEEMLTACLEDPANLIWLEGYAAAAKQETAR